MLDLNAYGKTDRWQALFDAVAAPGDRLARVVRQDRGFALLVTAEGVEQLEVRPEMTGPVVVGDWVIVDAERVTSVLDRTSFLSRRDAYNEAGQAVAANVDIVFVVCGADRPLKSGRIERAITQAWDSGATPVVVVTKLDLVEEPEALLEGIRERVPTADVIGVSSVAGEGLEQVQVRSGDKTVVLVGESGAGKSTLLNALAGAELALAGGVRQGDAKGRHTTTRRELYLLEGGGIVVDTPGVRSLGLWADVNSVDATFSDISEIADACRFSDCRHDTEPGCAVTLAVEAGEITKERVESWLSLREEAAAAELRKDEHARRQAERKFGRVVDAELKRKGRR